MCVRKRDCVYSSHRPFLNSLFLFVVPASLAAAIPRLLLVWASFLLPLAVSSWLQRPLTTLTATTKSKTNANDCNDPYARFRYRYDTLIEIFFSSNPSLLPASSLVVLIDYTNTDASSFPHGRIWSTALSRYNTCRPILQLPGRCLQTCSARLRSRLCCPVVALLRSLFHQNFTPRYNSAHFPDHLFSRRPVYPSTIARAHLSFWGRLPNICVLNQQSAGGEEPSYLPPCQPSCFGSYPAQHFRHNSNVSDLLAHFLPSVALPGIRDLASASSL